MKTKEYWSGGKNKSIRYYFYVQQGLGLLNEFRYLIMAVMAVYVMFKLDNPLYMVGMFAAAIPVLLFFGWLRVHHVEKVMEFLHVKHSTHWGRYGYELQETQIELLKEISDKLDGDAKVPDTVPEDILSPDESRSRGNKRHHIEIL